MFAAMTARLAAAAAAADLGLPPEAADEVLAHAQRSGIDFDSFGTERSSRKIIEAHNKALRSMVQQLKDGMYMVHTSQSWDVKPAADFPRPPPYSALSPISCQDLQLHTTHRRRVLKGKLVVDAILMTSIQSILQDEHGDAVKVSFYNTPGLRQAGDGNFRRAFCIAQQLFPKGQAVAIIEPFYKVATDGTLMVRVDNPSEVVVLDSLGESPEALQQQGDQHLAAHQYKEAVASYDKALLALQQQQQQQGRQPKANAPAEMCQMLLSVLLNLSASHLQLQQPMHALLYVTAAAAISSHKSSKAYYRAAVAWDRILGSASCSRSSSSSSSGTVAALGPAGPGRLAAVATALMEGSVSLECKTTPEAKAQMMAALTNVAAIQSKGGQASSSKKRVAEDGEWQLVCELLSGAAAELAGCFNSSSSTPGSSSSSSGGRTEDAAAAKAAGKEKELGNTAFKQGGFTTALQHYQASRASLQSSLGPIPTLLSSRAKAWLQQPSKHSQQHACMDGLAAALLDPKECAAGGLHTAAVALLQLDETAGAQELCELGLQLLPAATELQELLQRIHTAAAAATAAAQAAGSSGSSAGSSGSSHTSGASNSKSGKGKQGKKQASSSSRYGSAGSSSDRRPVPMTEREMKDYMQRGTLGVEQLSMVNQFAELAARMGRGGRAGGRGGRAGARGRGGDMADALFEMCRLDDRVPNLREEFAKAGRWPPQIDVQRASKVLWEAYESARALPMHMLALVREESLTPQLMAKRLSCLDRDRIDWLLRAELGEVSFRKEYGIYGGPWQSFVNAPSRTEMLSFGSTHVAIGFVDLGGLAAACTMMAAREPMMEEIADLGLTSAGSSSNGSSGGSGGTGSSSGSGSVKAQFLQNLLGTIRGKPLCWVGYEQSAYCVAKTLVLLQMVEQGAAVDEVLQVWFSSTWSSNTLEAFRRAVTQLLTASSLTPQQRKAAHLSADALSAPDVLELLRHWQLKQVTLAAARSAWLDNADNSFVHISNLRRKVDRLALTELALTGELRALGPGDTGSVVMFAVPRKFGERAFDECFLQCLPFQTLMEAWQSQPASDIVAVGVQLLRSRVRLLAGMLRTGMVKAEVHLGAVQLGNTSVISSVRSLEPYTISWSNVPDYMHPADFHKLAQAVSAPEDTVHFMHSMNWVLNVKGACHLDFMLHIPEGKSKERIKCMTDLKALADMAFDEIYHEMRGLQTLLLSPPVDNPRNVIDFGLYFGNHKKYVKAFFAPALSGMPSPERQMHIVEPPTYSIFSRTNSTMHVTFTYDDSVKLQATAGV